MSVFHIEIRVISAVILWYLRRRKDVEIGAGSGKNLENDEGMEIHGYHCDI